MINFGFLSLDIIILIVILLALFFYAFKKDKGAVNSLILSFYPAILIFANLPYFDLKVGMPQAIGFIVVYIIIFFILKKVVHSRKNYSNSGHIIDCALLSVAFLALLISVSANSVPALQNIYTFTETIPQQIAKVNYGLMLIIPLVVVFISNKRTN